MKKENKKVKELEQELKYHKDNYIHIPKFETLSLLGTLFFAFLTYINFKLVDWELIKIMFSEKEIFLSFTFEFIHLINIYPLIGSYLLISATIISMVSVFKGGYDNIKSYNDGGLIVGLIVGLIIGLIVGLIVGLIIGLIVGLIYGLIGGLMVGLIYGLIGGLIYGLIYELIVGLIWEFD